MNMAKPTRICILAFCLSMTTVYGVLVAKPTSAYATDSHSNSDFVVWQLQSTSNNIGMAYVFKMDNGEVAVLDGGLGPKYNADAKALRAKLASLGNVVTAWFISHPHPDHAGALDAILRHPGNIKIQAIYQSRLTPNLIKLGGKYELFCKQFYQDVDASEVTKINFTQPGAVITIDKTTFRILSVRNPEITRNPYNNSSMAIRVQDNEKSMVFLGDLHRLGGQKLLDGPYRKYLDCDYLQMAHHGNNGVGFKFYKSIKFSACLWPTPSWVWNNDRGKGFNTANYTTVKLRKFVKSLGIIKNYVAWKGNYEIN